MSIDIDPSPAQVPLTLNPCPVRSKFVNDILALDEIWEELILAQATPKDLTKGD